MLQRSLFITEPVFRRSSVSTRHCRLLETSLDNQLSGCRDKRPSRRPAPRPGRVVLRPPARDHDALLGLSSAVTGSATTQRLPPSRPARTPTAPRTAPPRRGRRRVVNTHHRRPSQNRRMEKNRGATGHPSASPHSPACWDVRINRMDGPSTSFQTHHIRPTKQLTAQ